MHQLNLLMKRTARMHYCILPPVYSCLLLLLLSFSANYQNREDRTMDDPFGESLALAPTAPLSEYRTTNRVGIVMKIVPMPNLSSITSIIIFIEFHSLSFSG